MEGALWRVLASSYHRKGRATEALQAASRGFPAEAQFRLGRGYEDEGWEGMLRVALDLRLSESELRCPKPRYEVMTLSAILGDRDRMFDCLESLNDFLPYTWAPIFNPYRGDPRFHALLRKWNLEDAPFASE